LKILPHILTALGILSRMGWTVTRKRGRPAAGQGCIKLGLVGAGAGVREVFPFFAGAQANPAGLAAGSRWSFRGRGGKRPPDTRAKSYLHPGGMPATRQRRQNQPICKEYRTQAGNNAGTHSGCRALRTFTRWSAPFALTDHRLPAANPAGLVSGNEIRTRRAVGKLPLRGEGAIGAIEPRLISPAAAGTSAHRRARRKPGNPSAPDCHLWPEQPCRWSC